MKRVLHIVGKMDRAGAETMLMNLYRHIDRDKIQFDFITFTNEAGDYDAEIIELGGRIIPVIANNPVERMLKLQRFLKQSPEYNIVHAHMLLSNAFHLLAAKGAGVKHRISHSHNTNNGHSSAIKKVYEQWALMINCKVATHKIACGELAANYLFGTTKDVWLLPNAVDVENMIKVANESQNYISQKFDGNGLKIIQVGRLNNVKNHQFSVKIAQELKRRKVDFTLYIIGQGPLEDELKQKVNALSLRDNVKFLGMRTDITELMSSADYMIMPSLHEGFPLVLVESQTVGLTALVSDQVSTEVDLGLGLVKFLPLASVNGWANSLINLQTTKPNKQEITNSMKVHGFDVATNAATLTQFYINL